MGDIVAQHAITITGNIITDPTLREFDDKVVCRLRVAASRAVRDEKGDWKNYDQLYISVECWGELARNCKLSLSHSLPVIVTGILVTHEWTDAEGKEQSRIVLKASHIGVDLGKYVVRPLRASVLDPTQQAAEKKSEDVESSEPVDAAEGERVDKVLAEHEKEMDGGLVGAAAGEEGGEPPF